ncbi:peptidase S8/S53 subtilisin kexin sedolisin [Planoprotostelium fungivorum]|uniref:Peptidase S8/S53 subtilisin kexin sedolisin n=1 Tax=Planoprotostelium fungivorum TaxID=1890364 RepID=A0A2P6NTH0_9EUKA|nr:peptidase S8/S53 subtilisin kexin sedolisin [Planoprotostelium fungivorum]
MVLHSREIRNPNFCNNVYGNGIILQQHRQRKDRTPDKLRAELLKKLYDRERLSRIGIECLRLPGSEKLDVASKPNTMHGQSYFFLFFIAQVLAASFIGNQSEATIEGRYFAVFHQEASILDRTSFLSRYQDADIRRYVVGEFDAILGTFDDSQLEQLLEEDAIDYIEADKPIYTTAKNSPAPKLVEGTCSQEENTVTWGLERLNQRKLPSPFNYEYVHSLDGTGVDAYILDSGIEIHHPEFEGRAVWGYNTADNENRDCMGHGTHTAGTVGSRTYGVAKNVTLIAVKIFGCDEMSRTSRAVDAMQWIYEQFLTRKKPAVVNFSASGPFSQTMNDVISKATRAGLVYVVAAGNNEMDACDASPGSCPDAITVGATNRYDDFAYFSCWGKCVDILAPGVNITSTYLHNSTYVMTGTSMSTPHVAGVVALVRSMRPDYTPAQVRGWITRASTKSTITSVPAGTPNYLAYVSCV